jgi:hypothetical protein
VQSHVRFLESHIFGMFELDGQVELPKSTSISVSCWPAHESPSSQRPSLAYINFRFVRCPLGESNDFIVLDRWHFEVHGVAGLLQRKIP